MVDADFGAAAAKDGAQGKGKANLEQLWPKLAQQPVSRGLVFTPAPTSLPLVSPSSFSSDFHPCDPAADYSMSNGLPPQFMVLQGRTSEPSPDYTHHQLMPLLLDMLDAEEGARKRLVEQLIKDGSATEEQQAAERRRREAWDEQWKLLNDMRNHQGMKALY
jgi:hypothetical protein